VADTVCTSDGRAGELERLIERRAKRRRQGGRGLCVVGKGYEAARRNRNRWWVRDRPDGR